MTVGRSRLTSTLATAIGLAVLVALPAIARPAGGDATQPQDATRTPAPAAGTTAGAPLVRFVKVDQGVHRTAANEAVSAWVAEFNAAMAAKLKGGQSAPETADAAVAVETLPNGLVRARMPVDRINVMVVRVGADGAFTNVCTESPRQAASLLVSRPVAASSAAGN